MGDVDADGDQDIVSVHWVSGDAVQVHLNNGDGTFAPALGLDTDLVDHGGRLADLDGNGTLDLIATSYWGQRVVVYPGAGDGTFGAALPNDAKWNPGGFGVGDVDGDDIPDIVVAQAFEFFDEGQAALLVGNGDGTFQPQVKFDLPADATDAALGDVDGDGVLDAVVAVKNANHIAVLKSRRGPWENELQPLAGTLGYPHQTGEGTLVGGEPFRFTLTDALPFSSAFHFVGLTELSAPFKGGVLVPFPHLVNGPLPVGADGTLVLAGPWPNGAPSGVSIWLQFWMLDGGGPAGFAASNAVKATMP
ncbi:MAG: FG-GAP repeat domain-containing protein [Planctomycetota bacterium]